MQRGDDDVGPEGGAVLANAPAFVLEPPLPRSDPELVLGKSLGDLLRRVEHREVLPDDLLRLVTLDAARTLVPAGDVTSRVEREDGVVAHRIDEQAIQVGVCAARSRLG